MRICAVDSAPDRERDKGAFWKGNWNISSGHIAYHGGCTGSHDENIRCGWIPEKSCQPAVETLDEKQQEDHSGDPAEMVKHLRNTDKIPDAWPEDLKDIPIPSITAINDILDDAEQDLKGYLAIADEKLPAKTILKHQLIAGGLRIIKNLVEDCQEEPEQPEQPDVLRGL